MANMLTSPDMHLLLLALSSIWHLVQLGSQQQQQQHGALTDTYTFDFLLQAVVHDGFYDTLAGVAVQSQDEQIRGTAAAIVEFADRVREEE